MTESTSSESIQKKEKPQRQSRGWVSILLLTLLLGAFVWLFITTEQRMQNWLALDKELFGFGNPSGIILSDSAITLTQRFEQLSSPGILVLCSILLWLLICAPILILIRDRRIAIARIWMLMGLTAIGGFSIYLYVVAWHTPNSNFAAKYELDEVPTTNKVRRYVRQITDETTDYEQAGQLVIKLGWIHDRSMFHLNPRPEQAIEDLAAFAGDEDQPIPGRLMAATAAFRMLTPEEVQQKKFFAQLKSAAEAAVDVEHEIAKIHLATLARATGAAGAGNLAVE